MYEKILSLLFFLIFFLFAIFVYLLCTNLLKYCGKCSNKKAVILSCAEHDTSPIIKRMIRLGCFSSYEEIKLPGYSKKIYYDALERFMEDCKFDVIVIMNHNNCKYKCYDNQIHKRYLKYEVYSVYASHDKLRISKYS